MSSIRPVSGQFGCGAQGAEENKPPERTAAARIGRPTKRQSRTQSAGDKIKSGTFLEGVKQIV
jgi:hypothetical protein